MNRIARSLSSKSQLKHHDFGFISRCIDDEHDASGFWFETFKDAEVRALTSIGIGRVLAMQPYGIASTDR